MSERDDLHICEQCGAEFSRNETTAEARFDFCSSTCERAWWLAHPQEKAAHPYWGKVSAQLN